ncbi:MAG: DNA polymerase III subunit delta [Proteiniphilum sp.]|nr:DNA polymerase III subunit delta [Proteiniphilum sp.]
MAAVTFESIKRDILNKKFSPIYLLMGDESFFIDQISDLLVENVLTNEEKDFNLLTFYGVDSDVNNIIASARRFPLMAEYQLIIIKEAQELDKFDLLDVYAKKPLKSTILVINYKHKKVDGRRALVKNINGNGGVVFESKKLYDNQVPPYIKSYFAAKKIRIDDKSAQMITDFVGNDISKLNQELLKLEISLPKDNNTITSDLVEKNIGISKDFNNFELLKAVISKDVVAANRIANYFDKNPKDNPTIVTISLLFNYFSNLLECFWLPQKNEQSVMSSLGLKSAYFARDYMSGLRNYNAMKVMNIISELRVFDAKTKGIGNVSATSGELLKELLFRIMH